MGLDTDVIRAYFFKLGLAPEITDIYTALWADGPQSLVQLSRSTHIERTRLSGLINDMIGIHLAEVEVRSNRRIIKAAPVSNLQILISKKEQEIKALGKELSVVEHMLEGSMRHAPVTKVQFYHGQEGLKQMLWNETKGTTENLAILYENMQLRTKGAFFERWANEMNERNIQCRGIIGDHFIEAQQKWYATHKNERIKNWTARYLPSAAYAITYSIVIHNDIVAYYNWKDGEKIFGMEMYTQWKDGDIFGIEVYNKEIYEAQRHFFEMLWAQAIPVDDLIGPQK